MHRYFIVAMWVEGVQDIKAIESTDYRLMTRSILEAVSIQYICDDGGGWLRKNQDDRYRCGVSKFTQYESE